MLNQRKNGLSDLPTLSSYLQCVVKDFGVECFHALASQLAVLDFLFAYAAKLWIIVGSSTSVA